MSEIKQKKLSAGIIAIIVWMVINAVFMALEVTVFGDAADLNNSILLVLMATSVAGLLFVKKYGAVLTAFTVTYAFSFNAFNLIYFGSSLPDGAVLLNSTSAIINGVATIFLFAIMLKSSHQ